MGIRVSCLYSHTFVYYRDLRKALFGRYKRKERVEDDRRDDRGRGGPRPGGRDDFRDRRRDRSPDRRGRSESAFNLLHPLQPERDCASSWVFRLFVCTEMLPAELHLEAAASDLACFFQAVAQVIKVQLPQRNTLH